jgi:hypothetical protein
MKKIFMIALAVIVCAAFTEPVYAEVALHGPLSSGSSSVTAIIGSAAFQPSTNVYANICSTAVVYTADTQNGAVMGNAAGRQFGATNTSAIQYGLAETSASPVSCGTAGVMPTVINNVL